MNSLQSGPRRRGAWIAAAVVLALLATTAWWFGRPVPRSGGPLNMGDVTYSTMVCASNTACTSADAMLRNDGDADIVVHSIELLDVSNQALGVGEPQLYTPTPEAVGSTRTGFPPAGARPENITAVHDTRLPADQDKDDRQILIPIRPAAAGHYWWQGYRVRYSHRGTEYQVTQPSWVAVCVDGVGLEHDGGCGFKRPAEEK